MYSFHFVSAQITHGRDYAKFSSAKVEVFLAYFSSQIGSKVGENPTPQPKYLCPVKILHCFPFRRKSSFFQRGNKFCVAKPWGLLVTAGRK